MSSAFLNCLRLTSLSTDEYSLRFSTWLRINDVRCRMCITCMNFFLPPPHILWAFLMRLVCPFCCSLSLPLSLSQTKLLWKKARFGYSCGRKSDRRGFRPFHRLKCHTSNSDSEFIIRNTEKWLVRCILFCFFPLRVCVVCGFSKIALDIYVFTFTGGSTLYMNVWIESFESLKITTIGLVRVALAHKNSFVSVEPIYFFP